MNLLTAILLTLFLAILRLCGVFDLSWWLVFLPMAWMAAKFAKLLVLFVRYREGAE